jgi:AP-2 complex subunit sigma-1
MMILFWGSQVYSILDEYILAGEIQETSKIQVLERIREMERYEKMSEKS